MFYFRICLNSKLNYLAFMELIVFVVTFSLAIVVYEMWRLKKKYGSHRLPPSLPSLPLVGSLPFIRELDNIPKFFLDKAQQLGPIFTFLAGSRLCLVLNNNEVIEEALVRNSSMFSGRNVLFAEIHRCNRNLKGIASRIYNAEFKRYHQLSLSILKEFGLGDRNLMESRILREVEAMVAYLRTIYKGNPINPKETLLQGGCNIILDIAFGIREDYENGIGEMAKVTSQLADSADPTIEVAPIVRFLPYFKQKYDGFCDATNKMVELIGKQIKRIKIDSVSDTFVSRYMEKEGPGCDFEQLAFTLRDFFGAGTNTPSSVLSWLFVFIANNPSILRRAQEEIDSVVPRDRLPSLHDESRLPFISAILLEIFRIRTTLPLSVPHVTLKDSDVGCFFVPSGTMVIPNLYGAHMDPKQWKDPNIFRPERFLDEHNNIVDRNKVIPFSLGRRSCLGEILGRQEVFLFSAGLLQNFKILVPENQRRIDDKSDPGFMCEPRPFKILMIPRN